MSRVVLTSCFFSSAVKVTASPFVPARTTLTTCQQQNEVEMHNETNFHPART